MLSFICFIILMSIIPLLTNRNKTELIISHSFISKFSGNWFCSWLRRTSCSYLRNLKRPKWPRTSYRWSLDTYGSNSIGWCYHHIRLRCRYVHILRAMAVRNQDVIRKKTFLLFYLYIILCLYQIKINRSHRERFFFFLTKNPFLGNTPRRKSKLVGRT